MQRFDLKKLNGAEVKEYYGPDSEKVVYRFGKLGW
jgi:hypothetical protein